MFAYTVDVPRIDLATESTEIIANRAWSWARNITQNDQKQAALVASYMDAAVRLMTNKA
jgi:hypothetical protein